MEKRFHLAEGRGWMTVQEEGNQIVIVGQLSDDRRGLYKGWLLGPGETRFLLGTFLPENGILKLRRRIPLSELKQRGIWPPAGAEAVLAFHISNQESGKSERGGTAPSGWEETRELERFLCDPLLKKAAVGLRGAIIRRETTGTQIALPFSVKEPLSLTPLFCLMQVGRLGERYYVRFHVNDQGWPICPKDG